MEEFNGQFTDFTFKFNDQSFAQSCVRETEMAFCVEMKPGQSFWIPKSCIINARQVLIEPKNMGLNTKNFAHVDIEDWKYNEIKKGFVKQVAY